MAQTPLLALHDDVNGAVRYGSDHARQRTPAEIAIGVTPTLYDHPPQDVRRYGADATGAALSRIAIQTAVDVAYAAGGATVHLPFGTYLIDEPIVMRPGVHLMGDGFGSCIRLVSNANFNNNLVKLENVSYAAVSHIRVDGNRTGITGGTQYGIYLGSARRCKVSHCYVHSTSGDGIHFYNSDGCLAEANISWDNYYHGMEIEQCRDCEAIGNHCTENLRHGLFVFQGEVGASGSKGITITGNTCSKNSQSGVVVQGELTEDIALIANICRENAERGMMIFDRVKGVLIQGNVIALNGHFGIYLYRISEATLIGNRLANNSQSANGGYQEIFFEGDSTQFCRNNVVIGNAILMNGSIRSAYGIKENSTSDGPTVVMGNAVPFSGTVGRIAVLHETGFPNSFSLCRYNIAELRENRGIATFDGGGTTFTIAHGISPDEPRDVSVTAGSPDAAGDYSVASNGTNIIVTYQAATRGGARNIILRWRVST